MAMKRPGIYVGLSAHYFDDTAIMEAGEDAELLYVRMLAYAARQMEHEGYISDRVIVSRLGILPRESGNGTGTVPGTDAASRAGVLAEVGLLTREEGGYRITGWLKWNRTAAELGKERTRDRVRKKPSDNAVSGNGTGTDTGNGTGTDAGVRSQGPDQTRPDHKERGESSSELALIDDGATAPAIAVASPTKRGSRIPEGWYPTRCDANLRAEAGRTPENLNHELEKFRDHWTAAAGSKGLKADWDATWRNWIKRSDDFAPKSNGRPRTAASMDDGDWAVHLQKARQLDERDAS